MALEPQEPTNNLTGIYLPDDTVRDISAFEGEPETGRLEGFGLSVSDALGNNPSINLALAGQREVAKKFEPGNLLTKSAWEKSEFFRPNLSFDGLKTSQDSVAENVARLAAAKLDSKEAVEARLNNMKPGFLSGATKFAGETAGFLLDPLNVAAFKGASLIVGKGNSLMLRALGETSFARTRQAALGSLEGALITVPSVGIGFETDKVFGQDPSAIAALATIGLNAGLGGIVRGAFGFKEPITPAAYKDAMETAANQLSAGKSVHIDEIAEGGYRDARLKEEGQLERASPEARADINRSLEANRENISELEDDVVKTQDKEKFDEKIRSGLQKEKGLSAKEILTKEKEISEKPEFARDSLDKLFLKKLPVNEEIKRAVDIRNTPKELRSPEEEQFLSDMLAGKEKDFIDRRLRGHQEEIDNIKSKFETAPEGIADAERLKRELDAFTKKISHGEARLFEIAGKRKPSPKIKAIQKDIGEAKQRGDIFDNIIQHHETDTAMRNNPGEAPGYNQVKASAEKIHSWEGDSVVDKPQNDAFNRETDAISDTPEIADFKEIEDLVKSLELSKEDKDIIAEGAEAQERFETMKKAIREAANCLIRNP